MYRQTPKRQKNVQFVYKQLASNRMATTGHYQ